MDGRSRRHRVTSAALADFVDFLWLAEGYAPGHPAERVLPTGCMSLVVELRPQSVTPGLISGARTSAFILDTATPLSLMGASFKAGGGYAFFAPPAGALQDLTLPLEVLWGSDAEGLRTTLLEAKSDAARFAGFERFLLSRLRGAAPRSALVQFALQQFQDPRGVVSVGEVVARTGLSARRFIAEFRDQVGMAPKTFCRVSRFRRVIGRIAFAAEVDWTETALACGYYDQAHFIHDFREFAGVSPSGYLRCRTASLNHLRLAPQPPRALDVNHIGWGEHPVDHRDQMLIATRFPGRLLHRIEPVLGPSPYLDEFTVHGVPGIIDDGRLSPDSLVSRAIAGALLQGDKNLQSLESPPRGQSVWFLQGVASA